MAAGHVHAEPCCAPFWRMPATHTKSSTTDAFSKLYPSIVVLAPESVPRSFSPTHLARPPTRVQMYTPRHAVLLVQSAKQFCGVTVTVAKARAASVNTVEKRCVRTGRRRAKLGGTANGRPEPEVVVVAGTAVVDVWTDRRSILMLNAFRVVSEPSCVPMSFSPTHFSSAAPTVQKKMPTHAALALQRSLHAAKDKGSAPNTRAAGLLKAVEKRRKGPAGFVTVAPSNTTVNANGSALVVVVVPAVVAVVAMVVVAVAVVVVVEVAVVGVVKEALTTLYPGMVDPTEGGTSALRNVRHFQMLLLNQ